MTRNLIRAARLDATDIANEANRHEAVWRMVRPHLERIPLHEPRLVPFALQYAHDVGWPVLASVMFELHKPGRLRKLKIPPELYAKLDAAKRGDSWCAWNVVNESW